MPIIDLSTGTVTDKQPRQGVQLSNEPVSEAPTVGRRVIDLDTGELVEVNAIESVQPQQAPAEVSRGIGDFFSGSERIEATPELGTLPEFGTTSEGDTPRMALGLLSTFDPKAQQDIIQEAIPEAVFETTADGSTIIEVPTEDGGTRRSVLNRPGFSPQDLTTATAQALSFIPAARLANLGKSLLQKAGIGAFTAGTTEQLLQETGVALGREERDPLETVIATGTGALAEVVVPAVQAIRSSRQARRVGAGTEEVEQVAESVISAREASEQTGVPLFQAQQTGVPAQLEKQSFVTQLPAGTQSAVTGLKAQNQAAGDAVDNLLTSIAPDEAVITGAERIRTAAQASIEKAKNIRAEKSSPIYREAFKEGRTVETTPVKELIEGKILDFPEGGQVSNTLKKALGLITDSPRLKNLHNAKLEIDQIINNRGVDAIGNTTKRELTEVQTMLLDQMDNSSPLYKQARDTFAQASPPVVKIQESIIGKVADLDDTQLKQVSSKIFDPAQTNPKVIADAKKAITDVDPDAWDQIVRVELERRLGSIKSTAEAGTVENIPGQLFRAIFPNDKSTKVLMNALDQSGRQNLKYLQTALRRASLGRPGGSQTAAREEIKRELRGGVFQSFRNFFKQPLTTLASTGEDAAFDRRVSILSKALFDPTWKAEMKNIRKFSPESPDAARAMTQLFNDIEASEPEQ